MHERIDRRPDVADLKQRLTAAWSCLQQHVIDEANDQRRGVTAVRLCENLGTFALINLMFTVFLHITVNVT